MNYIRNNKWETLVAVVFIFFSSTSFAVGFGKIKVYSYLNELLSAEIELIGVENIHTDLLVANLASPKDFVRANMARPFFLTKLSFEIIRHEEQTVIYVSSVIPVKNPFLDFLVELSLPDGKLVKGYTILIDPQPKVRGLVNRPQALKKRKALVNKNSKFDLPESLELIGTSVESKNIPVISSENKTTVVPEETKQLLPNNDTSKTSDNKIILRPAANNEENIITDNAALENALGDNIEVNKPTKTTGLLSGVVSVLKANPLFASSMIDSKQLEEEKNAAESTKVVQQPKNMATLKDLFVQDNNTDSSNLSIVKTIPADKNAFKGFDQTEKTLSTTNVVKEAKVISQQNNNVVNDKALYKKYGMQLILSFLMVLISGFFIVKILRRSHVVAVSEHSFSHQDLNEFDPVELDDLADIDEAIAEIKRQELSNNTVEEFNEEIDLSSNDLPNNNIETIDLEEVNMDLLSDNNSEIELKINLAKQYIEAGDSTSAKNIFDEIMDIASAEQKNEIENILKTLNTSVA